MERLLDRLPHGSRIAVIRLRSLGDCVLTTPALALLKNYRPDLKISVIVEPRFAAIFEGNPDVDEIRAQTDDASRADLALNLHGGSRSMWLTLATRAKYRAGFAHHRYSFIYSLKIPRAQEILNVHRRVHTAEHLASAMFWLGVPVTEIPRAKLSCEPAPDLATVANPYAVIHPFASMPDKTWRPERFVEVARRLSGIEPVFLAGPGDDTRPFESFRIWKNEPLARVKSLMAGASLFIGNDSGPAHIAAAFGVPVVVLFGSSEPSTWSPWRTESQVLTGLANVSPDHVLTAVESLKVRV